MQIKFNMIEINETDTSQIKCIRKYTNQHALSNKQKKRKRKQFSHFHQDLQ